MKIIKFKLSNTSRIANEILCDDNAANDLSKQRIIIDDNLYKKIAIAIKEKYTHSDDYPLFIKKIAQVGQDEVKIIVYQNLEVKEVNLKLANIDLANIDTEFTLQQQSGYPDILNVFYNEKHESYHNLQKIIKQYENRLLQAQNNYIETQPIILDNPNVGVQQGNYSFSTMRDEFEQNEKITKVCDLIINMEKAQHDFIEKTALLDDLNNNKKYHEIEECTDLIGKNLGKFYQFINNDSHKFSLINQDLKMLNLSLSAIYRRYMNINDPLKNIKKHLAYALQGIKSAPMDDTDINILSKQLNMPHTRVKDIIDSLYPFDVKDKETIYSTLLKLNFNQIENIINYIYSTKMNTVRFNDSKEQTNFAEKIQKAIEGYQHLYKTNDVPFNTTGKQNKGITPANFKFHSKLNEYDQQLVVLLDSVSTLFDHEMNAKLEQYNKDVENINAKLNGFQQEYKRTTDILKIIETKHDLITSTTSLYENFKKELSELQNDFRNHEKYYRDYLQQKNIPSVYKLLDEAEIFSSAAYSNLKNIERQVRLLKIFTVSERSEDHAAQIKQLKEINTNIQREINQYTKNISGYDIEDIIPGAKKHINGFKDITLRLKTSHAIQCYIDFQKKLVAINNMVSEYTTFIDALRLRGELIVNPAVKNLISAFYTMNNEISLLTDFYQLSQEKQQIDVILSRIENDELSYQNAQTAFDRDFIANIDHVKALYDEAILKEKIEKQKKHLDNSKAFAANEENFANVDEPITNQETLQNDLDLVDEIEKLNAFINEIKEESNQEVSSLDKDMNPSYINLLQNKINALSTTNDALINALDNKLIGKYHPYRQHFRVYQNYLQRFIKEANNAIKNFKLLENEVIDTEHKQFILHDSILQLKDSNEKADQLLQSHSFVSASLDIILERKQKGFLQRISSAVESTFRSFTSAITGKKKQLRNSVSIDKLKEYLPMTTEVSKYHIIKRLEKNKIAILHDIEHYMVKYSDVIKQYHEVQGNIEILDEKISNLLSKKDISTKDAKSIMIHFARLEDIKNNLVKIAATTLKKENNTSDINAKEANNNKRVLTKFGIFLAKLSPHYIKSTFVGKIRNSSYFINRLQRKLRLKEEFSLNNVENMEKNIESLINDHPLLVSEITIQQYYTMRDIITNHLENDLSLAYDRYNQTNINDKTRINQCLRELLSSYKTLDRYIESMQHLHHKLKDEITHASQAPTPTTATEIITINSITSGDYDKRDDEITTISENTKMIVDEAVRYFEQLSIILDKYYDTLPEHFQNDAFTNEINKHIAAIGNAQDTFNDIMESCSLYAKTPYEDKPLYKIDHLINELKKNQQVLKDELSTLKDSYVDALRGIRDLLLTDLKNERKSINNHIEKLDKQTQLEVIQKYDVINRLDDLDKQTTQHLTAYDALMLEANATASYETLHALGLIYFEYSALESDIINYESKLAEGKLQQLNGNKDYITNLNAIRGKEAINDSTIQVKAQGSEKTRRKVSRVILAILAKPFTKIANKIKRSRITFKLNNKIKKSFNKGKTEVDLPEESSSSLSNTGNSNGSVNGMTNGSVNGQGTAKEIAMSAKVPSFNVNLQSFDEHFEQLYQEQKSGKKIQKH